MNFRKMVVMGITAVMGMAGMAAAQTIVRGTDTPELPAGQAPAAHGVNMASGLNDITTQLDITVTVDNFAALYAATPRPDALSVELAPSVDPSDLDDPEDAAFGNVGFLFVETSFNSWDIIMRARNGGRLVRQPNADFGEAPGSGHAPIGIAQTLPPVINTLINAGGTVGAMHESFCATGGWTATPVGFTGGMTYACARWDSIPALSPGYYLRYTGDDGLLTGDNLIPIPVTVGIGTMRGADGAAWTGIEQVFNTALAGATLPNTLAESFVSIADLSATNGVHSFAGLLGALFNGAASTQWVGTELNGAMVIDALGAAAASDAFTTFGPIDPLFAANRGSFNGTDVFRETGSRTYPSMLFYISAMLDRGTSGALAGNRNGDYTETLEFTFWGIN
jgi:hypothetical protein